MSVNELTKRALFASERQQWDKALGYGREAARREPKNYLAHKRLSLALWYTGNKLDAVAAMQRCVAIKPDFESGHYNLACFAAVSGEKGVALGALARAIELDPHYRRMAREDDDFSSLRDDDDFVVLCEPGTKAKAKALAAFDTTTDEATNASLLRIGNELQVDAVWWESDDDDDDDDHDDHDVRLPIGKVLHELGDGLRGTTARHLLSLIIANPSIEACPFLHELISHAHKDDTEAFERLLCAGWTKRYSGMDAQHMSAVDYTLVAAFKHCPTRQVAEAILSCLTSHGADALSDFTLPLATVLADLPSDGGLYQELIETTDTFLHADTYHGESLEARAHRVQMALPPPTLDVESTPDDRWARSKAALAHAHPGHVINAGAHMAIQSNWPDIVALVGKQQDRILEIALDATLPAGLRSDAAQLLAKVGDKETIQKLAGALGDPSVEFLSTVGKVMHAAGTMASSPAAVDTILAQYDRVDDRSHERYEAVVALRFFDDPRIDERLIKALNEAWSACRREAIVGLGLRRTEAAVPHLVKMLRTKRSQLVTASSRALEAIDTESAIAALSDSDNYRHALSLARDNIEGRFAAGALLAFRRPELPDDLLGLLKCGDREVTDVAYQGLIKLGHEPALPRLLAFLLDRFHSEGLEETIMVTMLAIAAQAKTPSPATVGAFAAVVSDANAEAFDEVAGDLPNDDELNPNILSAFDITTLDDGSYGKALLAELTDLSPTQQAVLRKLLRAGR